MECQFGPRRKGVQPKKGSEQETNQNILYKAKTEEEQNEDEEMELDSEAMQDVTMEDGASLPSQLHPLVAEKICELVAQGHNQVYTVHKQLRRFVEHEMFKSEEVPERHSLCYFPTVTDIKNHIHEAQKALQLTAGPLATSDTEAIQIQPALCPVEDTAQPTPPPPPEAPELSSPAPPQPVLLSPSRFLQSSGSAGESISLCDPPDPARHEPAGECDLGY